MMAGSTASGSGEEGAAAVEPEPRISSALARLDECSQLTASAQIEVFADIHRRLAEVLADPRAQA